MLWKLYSIHHENNFIYSELIFIQCSQNQIQNIVILKLVLKYFIWLITKFTTSLSPTMAAKNNYDFSQIGNQGAYISTYTPRSLSEYLQEIIIPQ